MADHDELIELINAYIKRNGRQAITGQVLNGVLRAMVEDLGNVDPIVVDSEMSETSENPVQNKVITEALQAVDKIYWAQYGVTSASEVIRAKTDGKIVAMYYDNKLFLLSFIQYSSGNPAYCYFFSQLAARQFQTIYISVASDQWVSGGITYLQTEANKVNEVNESSDNNHYPSAKAVYDALPKDVVQYVAQTLTEAQKAQARQNIGATAPEIFWATYGTTTAAEIDAAVAAGKVVMCKRLTITYLLAESSTGHYYFTYISGSATGFLRLDKSSNVWSVSGLTIQMISSKAQTITGNETDTAKYPSTKAVADALGKMGVVSQTQTWTGSDAAGYDYTMSNLVRGIIPQIFIDEAENLGASFNVATGYFEFNGLTDISYKEMRDVLDIRPLVVSACGIGTITLQNYPKCPRTLPILYRKTGAISVYNFFRVNAQVGERTFLETVGIAQDTPLQFTTFEQIFYGAPYLKRVFGILKKSGTGGNFNLCFANCASLEEVSINGLDKNLSAAQSSKLTLASVVFLVDNAANTSAITITLHATAYARCQADTTEYTYSGQTYTGILAYAAAKNITIASA